jgi:hypothetical protein
MVLWREVTNSKAVSSVDFGTLAAYPPMLQYTEADSFLLATWKGHQSVSKVSICDVISKSVLGEGACPQTP